GLGVDLSHLYLAKTELQNTADAAALAGASALKLSATEKIPAALDRAVDVMNLNKYNFNNKNYVDVMDEATQAATLIKFAKNLDGDYKLPGDMTAQEKSDARFIRVTTPSVPINTFFAIPILGFNKALSAKATAGLSVPGNISVCIAPLSAVSCPPNDATCSLCDSGDPLYPNCTSSKYWGNCGGANPHAPQVVEVNGPDDPDGNGLCDPKKEFCKKCTYNIRSQGSGGGGPAAGNFQILRCAGNGANAVRQALAAYGTNCSCGLVSVEDEVETQTGVDAGAVRQGLNVRFDDYGGGGLNYSTDVPPDSNIAQGTSTGNGSNEVWPGINYDQYTGTGTPAVAPVGPRTGHTGVPNRRVLIIPIIPMTEFTDETGNQTVRIGGLAGFFMRAQVSGGNGGDIQVEYIGDEITSIIGFDPNDDNVTNIVTPVLYR
ncbi:MAG TPA: pilus assembly protein TadG-related protein, partial [Pyrinomonadaceae bacterium]